MRRLGLALFTAFALMSGMTLSASAQADLGNDGIDTNCNNNFFTSTGQARQYFADDGGSINRNVDDLDRDRDGTACDAGIDDVGGNGSQFPGGSVNGGSDDGATEDDGGGTSDAGETDSGGGTTDAAETDELPATGTGPVIDAGVNATALMFATVAGFLALAGLRISRRA